MFMAEVSNYNAFVLIDYIRLLSLCLVLSNLKQHPSNSNFFFQFFFSLPRFNLVLSYFLLLELFYFLQVVPTLIQMLITRWTSNQEIPVQRPILVKIMEDVLKIQLTVRNVIVSEVSAEITATSNQYPE